MRTLLPQIAILATLGAPAWAAPQRGGSTGGAGGLRPDLERPAESSATLDAARRDFHKRRRSLGAETVSSSERLDLARWALSQGLNGEALGQLDLSLREHPGHLTILDELATLHAEGRLTVQIEFDGAADDADDFERALERVGQLGPAARELALHALMEQGFIAFDIDGLTEFAFKSLQSSNGAERTAALGIIRLAVPGEYARALIMHAALDPHPAAREAAAIALGAADEPLIVTPLCRALSSDSAKLRERAATALGASGYASTVPALAQALLAVDSSWSPPSANLFVGKQLAYVRDFDVEVASSASIADPSVGVIGSGAVLDARVLSISVQRRAPQRAMCTAIQRLTGESPGNRESEWKLWWADSPSNPANAGKAVGSGPISNGSD